MVKPVVDIPPRKIGKANERQVGGSHYSRYGNLQPWDTFIPWNLNGFQAAIIAYVVRYREKGGIEDLKKSIHYLEKLIEIEQAKADAENKRRGPGT